MRALLLLCVVFYLCTPTPLDLVLLDPEYVQKYGAYCLDGSPSGYYWKKSIANPKSDDFNSWVIFFQGGGACVEPIDCNERKKGSLGSSKYWSKTVSDDYNLFSDNPTINPFYNWNLVFFPYCTGDTHTGSLKVPDIFGLYFSGHNSVEARIQHLKATTHINQATHMLISGNSAGGIGVFNNADFIKKQFPGVYFKGIFVMSLLNRAGGNLRGDQEFRIRVEGYTNLNSSNNSSCSRCSHVYPYSIWSSGLGLESRQGPGSGPGVGPASG
eukprot:TRINITY_DN2707_c0_g4_i6.p1 TRINITY_DN2707_c0_g4~~TRINITY_DN2707_c0_g4_i6.p1  ORF type:complete len:270 (-),score=25.53 TRINITY_DN2707_c0_g4_i6:847-1656(-)